MKKIFNKKIYILIIFILIIGIFYFISPYLSKQINWHLAKKAIAEGGYTYQIGLTNVTMLKCVTTVIPPVCEGGMYCYLKDVGTCSLYTDVQGKPAGGQGTGGLFSAFALAQAGVMPGGQLIAGGFSPTFMDQGVLAGAGGCYNCLTAKSNKIDRFLAWANKYIIAGFRQ